MLIKFCDNVDKLNDWTGRIAAFLIFPLCFFVFYEVISRYVFSSPTIWAWDVNVQLLGVLVAIGGGYALLHDSHVGVDVLVVNRSRKTRIVIELITYVFFFITIGLFLIVGIEQAWVATKTKEVDATFFAPPVYPLKIIIAVGFLLLLLQGVSKFIHLIIKYGSEMGDK
jgi:TRAP-type mannitol/chloroaromatic compound transport system permease small subunit